MQKSCLLCRSETLLFYTEKDTDDGDHTHMFITTKKHKPDRKYKVQRSAGLKQEWIQMQCRGRVGLTCPVSSGLPSPSLSWPSTNSICGNLQPCWRQIPSGVSGVLWGLLSPIHRDYPALNGPVPKAMTPFSSKTKQNPDWQNFLSFIHISPPNPRKKKSILTVTVLYIYLEISITLVAVSAAMTDH